MSSKAYVVPNRSCGQCTACCRELAIVDERLLKLPGVDCAHCVVAGGCAIYDARPTTCRDYDCLWRSIPGMTEDWRPDRSGIMMVHYPVPPGFAGPFAVKLILVGEPQVLRTDGFAGMMAGFIDRGTATYFDLPGPPGMYGHHRLLNPVVGPAVAARDLLRVKHLIWTIYRELQSLPTRAIAESELLASDAALASRFSIPAPSA